METATRTLYRTELESPVGTLTLIANDAGLVAVLWEHDDPKRVPLPVPLAGIDRNDAHPVLKLATRQIEEYFAGERTAFDLPLVPSGPPFFRRVMEAVAAIPYGRTMTYGEIAAAVGNPAASRAVGEANRRNPLSIVVPCHRVVGAAGKLTGYVGGIAAKRSLLTMERLTARDS